MKITRPELDTLLEVFQEMGNYAQILKTGCNSRSFAARNARVQGLMAKLGSHINHVSEGVQEDGLSDLWRRIKEDRLSYFRDVFDLVYRNESVLSSLELVAFNLSINQICRIYGYDNWLEGDYDPIAFADIMDKHADLIEQSSADFLRTLKGLESLVLVEKVLTD